MEHDKDWQQPQIKKLENRNDSGYNRDTKLSTETLPGGYNRDTKPAATNPHPNVADTMMEYEATKEFCHV